MTVYGPDVSHYQGTIDWNAVAHSEGFAIIKASQGMSTDATFTRNRAGSLALPVRGAYHFGQFAGDPVAQGNYFAGVVGKVHNGDMLWLDAEDPAAVRMSHAHNVSWIGSFLTTVCIDTGLPKSRVGIYTGAWWWNPNTGGSAKFADRPLWVSGYTTKAPIPTGYTSALLWQYTNKATVPGISGRCDRSVYSGSLAQLRARAGNPLPLPPGGSGAGVPVPPNALVVPPYPKASWPAFTLGHTGPHVRALQAGLGQPQTPAGITAADIGRIKAWQWRHMAQGFVPTGRVNPRMYTYVARPVKP